MTDEERKELEQHIVSLDRKFEFYLAERQKFFEDGGAQPTKEYWKN